MKLSTTMLSGIFWIKRLKQFKIGICTWALMLPFCVLQAQHFDAPDSVKTKRLNVTIRTHNFFKDNEYRAEKLAGYSLPGFTFAPVFRFDYIGRLSLEAGLHLLHFWGADRYPLGVYYGVIPSNTTQSFPLFRIKPVLRARVSFNNKINIVLGSLYNNQCHRLPTPLYNRELSYAADPEAGGQVLMDLKHLNFDLWFDWQNFSFRNSATQEQFVFGCSAIVKPVNKAGNWTMSIPLHFLAQHHGGEFTVTEIPIVTEYNAAAGLDFRKYFRGESNYLQLGCLVAGYAHSRAEGMPFRQGWGIYPSVQASLYGITLEMGVWRSGCFIPILGSPHFGNISTVYEGLVFDPMTVVHTQLTYDYHIGQLATLQLEAGMYVYPPYSGDRPGYDKVIRGSAVGFDFGIHLHINPEFDFQ